MTPESRFPRLQRLLAGDRRDPRVALEHIIGTSSRSGSPQAEALEWGREVLAAEGIDPQRSPVEAVRALRQVEPRLDLRPATYLVQHLGAGGS